MKLPSKKFRRPVRIALVVFMILLLGTGSFVVLDKFFVCMYQLPYLTLCSTNYCCQHSCPLSGTVGCKPLNQQPYATATFIAATVSGSVTLLLIILCVCCSCTTEVKIAGDEQHDSEIEGEESFVSNEEAEIAVEMANLSLLHQGNPDFNQEQARRIEQPPRTIQGGNQNSQDAPPASRFSKYRANR